MSQLLPNAATRWRNAPRVRRPLGVFIFLFAALEGCSFLPSHIHDSDRAARTAKLAVLVDQYGEKSPGIYDTLLQSSRNIATEQDKLLAGLAANRNEAYNQMLPLKTGRELGKTRNKVGEGIDEVKSILRHDMNTYLKEKAGSEGDAKTAAEAIKSATAKVEEAQAQVTNWNKTIAVLETGVADLPTIGNMKPDTKKTGIKMLQDEAAAVAKMKVTYVDASGKQQESTIKDALTSQLDLTADGKPLLGISDAPGATVAILTLGVDLARVQKQAAEAKLAQLSRRLQLYERVQAELALAAALLQDIEKLDKLGSGNSKSAFIVGDKNAFDAEVVRLAEQARAAELLGLEAAKSGSEDKRIEATKTMYVKTDTLTSRLIELRELAIAQAIATRTSMDLTISQARLDHEESILDSQANDVAWRTVIRSGVVVLDQYEQGGFTAQDARDIISLAQTIAVGVIAGRVQ